MVLIILMSVTTFTTQRQLMRRTCRRRRWTTPSRKQQKVLLYVMPLFFAISGVNFPIGVLLYWLTTNVWSMGQQFYVIRRMPAPGSPAEKAMQERRAKRGKPVEQFTVKGLDASTSGDDETAKPTSGQRQQPSGTRSARVLTAKSPRGGQGRPGRAAFEPAHREAPHTDN